MAQCLLNKIRTPNADALTTKPKEKSSKVNNMGSWRSGSASASHAEGHRFEPCTAHFFKDNYEVVIFKKIGSSTQTALCAAG